MPSPRLTHASAIYRRRRRRRRRHRRLSPVGDDNIIAHWRAAAAERYPEDEVEMSPDGGACAVENEPEAAADDSDSLAPDGAGTDCHMFLLEPADDIDCPPLDNAGREVTPLEAAAAILAET